MTYEETIRVAATVLDHPSIYMGGPSGQSIKRATAVFEAIGLKEMMDDAACWRELDDFRNHLAEQLIEQTAAHLKTNNSAK